MEMNQCHVCFVETGNCRQNAAWGRCMISAKHAMRNKRVECCNDNITKKTKKLFHNAVPVPFCFRFAANLDLRE